MSVTLDILSDPICPWCYIGKARLESALGKRAAAEAPVALDLQWRPFQLNPEMPADGMDRRAYLEAKFGGKEGAVRVYSAIQSAAEEDGLEIAFDKIERTPNTIDAHRLIRWARIDNAQNAVVDALFRRYFVEGDDISNPEVLTETAIAAGMDGDLVARLLASDADCDAVAEEDKTARQMGVSAVPTFVLAGRFVVPGAQDAATWLRIFDELDAATPAA